MNDIDKEIKIIGTRIKILRQDNNMTQKELASRLGISVTNMCNIEAGKTAATIQNLLKLRYILNCDITDFFVDLSNVEKTKPTIQEEAVVKKENKPEAVPESQELMDAIALLRVIRSMNIKGL